MKTPRSKPPLYCRVCGETLIEDEVRSSWVYDAFTQASVVSGYTVRRCPKEHDRWVLMGEEWVSA